MKLTSTRRQQLALVLTGVLDAIGSHKADTSETPNEFTNRREHRPPIQQPVESDDRNEQDHEVCIIDIETTGVRPDRDAIIEIGIIRIETRDHVSRHSVFNELVRPVGNIPKAIRDLTGITNEAVQDADRIDKVLPRATEFIADAPLVAHNAGFDRGFLEQNARLMGRMLARNDWTCTLRMAKQAGLEGPYELAALAEKMGVQKWPGHRALDDCWTTLGVWLAIDQRLDEHRNLPTSTMADLNNKVFAFSGFRDEVLAARIANAGGRVAPSVSRDVTTLLVLNENTTSGKATKARKDRIKIQTKQDFENEFYIAP